MNDVEMEILKKADDALWHTSNKIFEEGCEQHPALLAEFFTDINRAPRISGVSKLMADGAGKNLLSVLIRVAISKPDVAVVAMVSESWAIARTREQMQAPDYVPPSDAPDRKEVIVFAYTTKDDSAMSSHAITRTESGIKLTRGELILTNTAGRFLPNAKPIRNPFSKEHSDG